MKRTSAATVGDSTAASRTASAVARPITAGPATCTPARASAVLLITATPVVNRVAALVSPLRLFLPGHGLALLGVPSVAAAPTPLPPEKPEISKKDKDKGVPAKFLFASKKLPSAGKSQAIGYYPRGCLQGAVELPINGPTWQVMRLSRNRMWGHPELIRMLERLSEKGSKVGWPGLLVGALLYPHLRDAVQMLEDGYATPGDVDAAMMLGCGYPMGPFTLLDFVGLDTTYHITHVMFEEFKEKRFACPPLLKRMVSRLL